ncbi:hypothetical protein GOODEAATRI_025739 [Goodea atripinnis]|uniref:Uncharacterized protein n=1 Tax=Goodea atripinnis TaxID=208336 RepID=A0ABV0PH32_9TELE
MSFHNQAFPPWKPLQDAGTIRMRSDPQCAAVVLLMNTLYASPENRCWPSSEEVLILRNSPYACVLAYMGLGDTESIGRCYEQLGRLVFLLRRQQVLHMQHLTACPWHN